MEPKKLNCHKGLSEKDAICIGCERAKEKSDSTWEREKDSLTWKNMLYMTRPDGSTKLKKIKRFTGDCDRWQLKQPGTICGCAGEFRCKCGWVEQFCFQYDTAICPWCERTVSFKSYRPMFGEKTNKWRPPGAESYKPKR